MEKVFKKIKVIHFQRKPRPGFNFSIEQIFSDLRGRLKDKVEFSVATSSMFNDGYFSKLINMSEAAFRQKKDAVCHITGEVYFIDLLLRKKNVLLTIHDCRFMERKKGIEKKLMQWMYLKGPVRNAAYVIVVSEATKQDVIGYTGCDPKKIEVIPVSVDTIFKPAYKAFNKECPVILQVGAAENKNISRLAEALQGMTCKLVIVGSLLPKDKEKLGQCGVNYTVKTGLSPEALYMEYIQCDIVSFVSTFEGFGMPIVEANCVERAVITSNISSLPEVAGDAACFVNPFDIYAIKDGFKKVINDSIYREQLIANGRDNRKRFNGDVIANAYYEIYEKIVRPYADSALKKKATTYSLFN